VLLNDPILRQKPFLGPQWSKKQFQTMGFIFQRQLGVFVPQQEALPHMRMRGSAPGHGIEKVYFPSRSLLNPQ
jgi:hypothetical protein